jgi:hypothetical protein
VQSSEAEKRVTYIVMSSSIGTFLSVIGTGLLALPEYNSDVALQPTVWGIYFFGGIHLTLAHILAFTPPKSYNQIQPIKTNSSSGSEGTKNSKLVGLSSSTDNTLSISSSKDST